MKTCSKCGVTKEESGFYTGWYKAKDGKRQYLHGQCKECEKAAVTANTRAKWESKYKGYHKERTRQTKRKRKPVIQARVNELKSGPCSDCGRTLAPICMDFDHLSDKVANVAALAANCNSWKTLTEEIAKCELVCACCHRVRTAQRERLAKGDRVYSANPATRRARECTLRLQERLDSTKNAPCSRCRETFPPVAMDYDHIDPTTKSNNITTLVQRRRKWAVIEEELKKCRLLCANCHRLETHE